MLANLLTTTRLFLVLPIAPAFACPDMLDPRLLWVLLCLAVATDYADGKVARLTGTASAQGQLFDHGTDCLFVTAGLTGAAAAGLMTPILPVLIIVAFSQYVLDSYFLYRQKQLRLSTVGRWNGIFYLVPLFLIAGARLDLLASARSFLAMTAGVLSYALVISTVISVIDRATAPFRQGLR